MRRQYCDRCCRQGNDGAGTDVIAFGDEGLGEVAIADGEVAVTDGDIKTRTFVSAYLDLVIYKNIAIFALLL